MDEWIKSLDILENINKTTCSHLRSTYHFNILPGLEVSLLSHPHKPSNVIGLVFCAFHPVPSPHLPTLLSSRPLSSVLLKDFIFSLFRIWSSKSLLESLSFSFILHSPPPSIMAEFVRAQIFGTTFEITSRFAMPYSSIFTMGALEGAFRGMWVLTWYLGIRNCSRWEWVPSDWSGMLHSMSHKIFPNPSTY